MEVHKCSQCLKMFSRVYNLRRHLKRRVPCSYGEKVGVVMILDPSTGCVRRQTPDERKARSKARKRKTYLRCASVLASPLLAKFTVYRNIVAFRQQAQVRKHQKCGREGSSSSSSLSKSKLSERQRDGLKWRRIIRAVHWRRFGEIAILCRSMDLARIHSPGDENVPKWVHSMYRAMKKYGV
jgi:hypothetical protein